MAGMFSFLELRTGSEPTKRCINWIESWPERFMLRFVGTKRKQMDNDFSSVYLRAVVFVSEDDLLH